MIIAPESEPGFRQVSLVLSRSKVGLVCRRSPKALLLFPPRENGASCIPWNTPRFLILIFRASYIFAVSRPFDHNAGPSRFPCVNRFSFPLKSSPFFFMFRIILLFSCSLPRNRTPPGSFFVPLYISGASLFDAHPAGHGTRSFFLTHRQYYLGHIVLYPLHRVLLIFPLPRTLVQVTAQGSLSPFTAKASSSLLNPQLHFYSFSMLCIFGALPL